MVHCRLIMKKCHIGRLITKKCHIGRLSFITVILVLLPLILTTYFVTSPGSFRLYILGPADAITSHARTSLNNKGTLVVHSNLKSVLAFWSLFSRENNVYNIAHQGTALTIFRDGKLPLWEDDADFFLPPASMKRLRNVLNSSSKKVRLFLSEHYGEIDGFLVQERYFFMEPKVTIFGYWFKVFDLVFRY